MNIKLSSALLIAGIALHLPAFAQSGVVHFQGRIVAPVCSGTPIADQSRTHTSNAQPGTLSMDNTGCENSAGALIASAHLAQNNAPTLPAFISTDRHDNGQDELEPVWTITYH